jgi:hypothetical protein
MAIDFYEREVERLTIRFNKHFGGQTVCNLRLRYLSVMAICQAGILARSIRDITDEKRISDLTREFCHIRDVLNQFFDSTESQQERRSYGDTGNKDRIAISG